MVEKVESPRMPYIAILLSESSGSAAGRLPLYCEDVVLVHAENIDEARERAQQRGERAGTEFTTADGERVRWSFVQVVDVCPVLDDDLGRDADLYARFFRDLTAYRRFEPLLDGAPL